MQTFYGGNNSDQTLQEIEFSEYVSHTAALDGLLSLHRFRTQIMEPTADFTLLYYEQKHDAPQGAVKVINSTESPDWG